MDNSQTGSSTENKNATTEGANQIDSSGGAGSTQGVDQPKTGLTDE